MAKCSQNQEDTLDHVSKAEYSIRQYQQACRMVSCIIKRTCGSLCSIPSSSFRSQLDGFESDYVVNDHDVDITEVRT